MPTARRHLKHRPARPTRPARPQAGCWGTAALAALALAAAGHPRAAAAQGGAAAPPAPRLECASTDVANETDKQGPSCVRAPRAGVEQIALRVLDAQGKPQPYVRVVFGASAGVVDSSAWSDGEGRVTARWSGARAKDTATVEATTTVAGARAYRRVLLIGEALPAKPGLQLRPYRENTLAAIPLVGALQRRYPNQHWYADRQLRGTTAVGITRPPSDTAPLDSAACVGTRVAFKDAGGGAVTNDTVRAQWRPVRRGPACTAGTRWKLGPVVGEQVLRASVVGRPDVAETLRGRAHAAPWIAAGLAVSFPGTYQRLAVADRVVRVTQTDTLTKTQTATDRTEKDSTVRRVAHTTAFTPTVGINFTPALVPVLNALRVSVSADARHLDRDWFVGVSVPRLFDGLTQEAVGADVHLVAHLSRRDDAVVGAGCAARPIANCAAANKGVELLSVGVLFQVNTVSLLTTLLAGLGK
jgi:hypothetical protein